MTGGSLPSGIVVVEARILLDGKNATLLRDVADAKRAQWLMIVVDLMEPDLRALGIYEVRPTERMIVWDSCELQLYWVLYEHSFSHTLIRWALRQAAITARDAQYNHGVASLVMLENSKVVSLNVISDERPSQPIAATLERNVPEADVQRIRALILDDFDQREKQKLQRKRARDGHAGGSPLRPRQFRPSSPKRLKLEHATHIWPNTEPPPRGDAIPRVVVESPSPTVKHQDRTSSLRKLQQVAARAVERAEGHATPTRPGRAHKTGQLPPLGHVAATALENKIDDSQLLKPPSAQLQSKQRRSRTPSPTTATEKENINPHGHTNETSPGLPRHDKEVERTEKSLETAGRRSLSLQDQVEELQRQVAALEALRAQDALALVQERDARALAELRLATERREKQRIEALYASLTGIPPRT